MLKDIAKLGLSSPWERRPRGEVEWSQGLILHLLLPRRRSGVVVQCRANSSSTSTVETLLTSDKKLKCLDLIACKIFHSSAAFSAGRMTGDETKVEQRENRCASGDVDK
jgi:hypothetical protein